MSLVWRRSLGCALLAAAVALGLLFLQRDAHKRTQQEEARASDAKILGCPDEAQIVAMVLRGPNDTLLLDKRTEVAATADVHAAAPSAQALKSGEATAPWQLRANALPKAVAADGDTVRAMLQASCALTQLGATIDTADVGDGNGVGQEARRAAFGLQPPRYQLELRDVHGQSYRLEAGHKNNFDGSLFVRRGGEAGVRRVEGHFAYQLERDALSLREKRALLLAPQDMAETAVWIAGAHGSADGEGRTKPTYLLERQEQHFALQGPEGQQPADPAAAQSLLAALSALRGQRFVAESPDAAALARFGLQRPHLLVRVIDLGQKEHTLRFGRLQLGDANHDFVQADDANAAIVELPGAWLVDKLLAGATELREMRVLDVDADSVARWCVQAQQAGGTQAVCFARHDAGDGLPMGRQPFAFARDGNGAQAAQAAAKADPQRIATALARLTDLRADAFAAGPADAEQLRREALEPAPLTVTFEDAAGHALATLRAGRQQGVHRAVLGNRRTQVAQIFAAALEGVDAETSSWTEPAPPAAD